MEEVRADWPERWREFHRPVRAGGLWIGPPWEPAPPGPGAVVIDPGQAFGTGAHPTTRLCLELLATLPRGPLLDAGCGSGVLAIAAVRLGFEPVFAIDDDPLEVEAAAANAGRNRVELELSRGNALAGDLPDALVTVANISLAAVTALARRSPGPLLVTSGYLDRDDPKPAGYRRRERRCAAGWAAETFERIVPK